MSGQSIALNHREGLKLLLVGASGLVGRHVLQLALAAPGVACVAAPARRALPGHPKLFSPQVDFESLPAIAAWWAADAVICTLGTTCRAAGSEAAFRRVDHDYPLDVARLAHAHGTPTFVLNSAIGANPQSRFFYNRVKGELELDLQTIGFRSLTLARPGVIGGRREEFRLGERLLVLGLTAAAPLLPKHMRLNPAVKIAQALLDAAIDAQPGRRILPSASMA